MKDIQDVWGEFEWNELHVMLFSFTTTCDSLLNRAKQDKQLHDIYDPGSPGDMRDFKDTGETQRHKLQGEILHKQKMWQELQDMIEQVCYVLDLPFREKGWKL